MESRWDDNRPSDPVIPEDPAVLSDAKRVYRETEIDPFLDEGVVPIEAQCPYFGVCGGCHLQHLPYDAQLQVKTRRVSHAFKAAGVELPLPDRIRGMDDPWSYRNKVDFSTRIFGGVMRLGFSHFGSGRVVETEACAIASHSINEALGGFRRAFPEHPRLKRKIHSLILRSGNGDTEAVALYHTRLKDHAELEALTGEARGFAPRLKGGGFVNKKRMSAFGDIELSETLSGIEYRYSLGSFFQANPEQTARLVEEVLAWADPQPADRVLDLYSGVGLFTLQLASRVAQVVALEDSPSSCADASANTERLGLSNVLVLKGQVEARLPVVLATDRLPDLAVLDPPRSGCAPEVLETLISSRIPRLVYVSCDPRSLAGDAALLIHGGYRLAGLSLVDMFPQTLHVECVASFIRSTC